MSENQELYAYVWAPVNSKLHVVCTTFTSQYAIEVLNKNDYITINGEIYKFDDSYISMDEFTFTDLLNKITGAAPVEIVATNSHLLEFRSINDQDFTINDMSYNVKLLTGFFKFDGPMTGKVLCGDSIPYYNGTPILYLVSTLGATNFTNITNKSYACSGMTTLMKINNSMYHGSPITAGNADFAVITNASVLSNCYFKVVDQNLHDIKLFDPFVITLKIRTLDKEES